MEVEIHRFVLAELNTHRSHSRSSASSRAIPVSKQIDRVASDPAWPLVWASEQPGMQGGDELGGDDLIAAQSLFEDIRNHTVSAIDAYLRSTELVYGEDAKAHTLHKSLINRLLEPFMWHKVIFASTADGWENFFAQRASRYSPLAQPELRAAADMMLEIYESSTPIELEYGDWVLPYIQPDEEFSDDDDAKRVSVARCARVSYLNHGGARDLSADKKLWSTLVSAKPKHAAPMEFVCTPMLPGQPQVGNFIGYTQLRHLVESGEFL
jgi:hypothetical protein